MLINSKQIFHVVQRSEEEWTIICVYILILTLSFLVIWKAWLVKEKVWTARTFLEKKLPKGKAAILVNSWSDWFSDCKYFRNCPISCDNNFLLIISIMLQPVVFQRLWISWIFCHFFSCFEQSSSRDIQQLLIPS